MKPQDSDIKLVMEGAPDCVNEVLNSTHSSEDARIAWVRDLERRVKALEACMATKVQEPTP